MITGIDGGKIGPTIAEAPVSAAANGTGKPSSFIALISMRPMPPTSASAAPETPEKMRLPTMLTCASPPGRRPDSVLAK